MARKVPQEEWPQFLADFTDGNQGRKATIEIGEMRIGDATGEDAFVLTGVEAGVMAEEENTLVVELADMEGEEQGHVTHRFEDVSELRVEEREGVAEGLEIEVREGPRATLRLEEEIPIME